jgi:glycosyltransferase involved in cell wall biosynthesis
MRILLLANKYPYPPRDGSSIAILSSLRAWVRAGAEVHLAALNPKKSRVDAQALPTDLQQKVQIHSFDINTDVTPWGALFNLLGKRPYHISRFYRRDIAHYLERLLLEEQFDVLQWEGPFMGEYLPHFAQTTTTHWLRAHNVEHRIWVRMAERSRNPLKRWYLKLQANRLKSFELDFTRKMQALLAISEVDEQFFQREIPGLQSMVWLPGVDVQDYPRWGNPEPNCITTLASFDWEPNREGVNWFLEEVMPLIRPEVKIKIGGRNMPAEWKKNPRVEWTEDVVNAKAFVLQGAVNFIPLWSGSGIRIKMVEGAAMGVPMVATTIAAEGSGLTHEKELVIADDARAFAAAIHQLLDDDKLREEYSLHARTFAEKHYDLASLGQNLMDFYRKNFS